MDGAAKLASDLRASPVELVDASEQTEKPAQIDLRNGRHPLMVLSGV